MMLLKCHIQTLCGADSADDRLKYALRNDLKSTCERLSVIDNVWICFISLSSSIFAEASQNSIDRCVLGSTDNMC